MSKKYVYLFTEGKGNMKELLGGKGANLAEMTGLGMPVPQGFTVTTEACTRYYNDQKSIAQDIKAEILEYMAKMEGIVGKKFGDATNPLLVSVRSGARASMPGMMDTILNLGMNDTVVESVAKLTDNSRFAYDSYRRFIQMFSDVVMELPKRNFEVIIDEMKEEKGIKLDTEFTSDDLKEMVKRFKAYYSEQLGSEFPSNPEDQLLSSIEAVFRSWDNERAIFYRRMNDIPSDWGTAVNVQSMVFGNMGEDSGTGVAFSRNPSNGERKLYGEFLMNAQGEDVVAGIRTPQTIDHLKEINPEVYKQFTDIVEKIEKGTLYMLQTRNGKRTAAAALKIACDLVDEGHITEKGAVMMIDPKLLDALLHPQFEDSALKSAKEIATGLAASPGAACGVVTFSADEATKISADGTPVILVRLETSPEDIEGMHVSQGILTARGGMTSHAAVVARGMGTCCVAGCGELIINESEGYFEVNGVKVNRGEYISLNGTTGKVYAEKIATKDAEIGGDFSRLMEWADSFRELKVRTNADTPADAKNAISFGAEGIGLCRTEHMFFESDRIKAMREMILSKTHEQRLKALNKLLPMQRGDFEEIYEVMGDLPVTIRYLDPPLHEFLPTDAEDIKALAKDMDMSVEEVKNVIDNLHEFNPMMGHRGCRLAVSFPEIAEMQTTAVIEAAINVKKRRPELNLVPEIMIPLIGEFKELQFLRKVVTETADKIIAQSGIELKYMVGTMIEIPRAALRANDLAKEAEFFSFGTNDLTQMTFGFSRDDAGAFLDSYYAKQIYEYDPFAKLDRKGVGRLVKTAVELGRETRPDIKLGICGEHGGDPSSIEFCQQIGLAYVSCSPFRVPIARLAAAQAAINYPNK